MSEILRFEVRPLAGGFAAVGEEVVFREDSGKLLALNEDGEPFGVVPKAMAARLEEAGIGFLSAEVASRADGIPTISVKVAEAPAGDAAAQGAAAADMGAAAEGVPASASGSDRAAAPAEAASAFRPAADELSVKTSTTSGSGGHFDQPYAPADASGTKKSKVKCVVIAAVAAAVIVIVACVGLLSGGATQNATQTVSSDWLSIEVPEDWTVETLNEDAEPGSGLYCCRDIYSDEPGFYVRLAGPLLIDDGYALIEEYDDWLYGSEFTMDGAVVHQYQVDSDEVSFSLAPDDYELTDDFNDFTEWAGYVYYIYSGSEYMVLTTYCLADEYDQSAGELETIWDSVVLEDASEPESAVPDILDADAADEDSSEGVTSSSSDTLQPEIIESGYYLTDDGDVYFGVGWENPNESYAIEFPELIITGRDADGDITFMETESPMSAVSMLLPGEIQYFGGYAIGEEGTVTVEFSVMQVDDDDFVATDEVAEEYYTISNTNVTEGDGGRVSFTGEITTNVEFEDVSSARVSVILRDEGGNIVYGYFGWAGLAGERETAAFEKVVYDVPEYATYEIYATPWHSPWYQG